MRASLGYIEELGIALLHEWKPSELFVIFTAYLDEADTHGPDPTVVMSGFIGHAYQWRRFEVKLKRLQARDGFTIFHGKDIRGRSGEFSGWAHEKRVRLLEDLTALVRDNLTEGVTVALERDRYLNEYRAPPIPKKMNLDSQYGVCFRACMSHLIDLMMARGNRDRLHVVIERGHHNAMDCERIFNDMKNGLRRGGIDILGTFTIESKTSCHLLMMADFLAGTHSRVLAAKEAQGLDYQAILPEPPKGEASLTFLELLPEALWNLKKHFELNRQQQVEQWRRGRDARKAALGASGRQPV